MAGANGGAPSFDSVLADARTTLRTNGSMDHLAAAPDAIVPRDRPYDNQPGSSIEAAGELAPYLPEAGVILIGHAHPPLRSTASYVDVSMRVGPIQKTVRAHGLRTWMWGTFGGLVPGPSRVPLLFTRDFMLASSAALATWEPRCKT